jgi:hypothetical protein
VDSVFTLAARYFCPILADFGPSQQIFVNVPQYQIPQKSAQWQLRWYIWADGGIDRHDKAKGQFSLVMNARN